MALQLKQIVDLPEALSVSETDLVHIRNGSVDKKITYRNLIGDHADRIDNPHQVTKEQIGLENLTGNLVLEQQYNLADVPDKEQGRINLGVPSLEDLNTAVPTGVIMMWSGTLLNIPTGYGLCDGSNGTPNLTNRFVVGASTSFPLKSTGGSASVSHSHAVNVTGHSLTLNEIPEHSHDSGWGEEHSIPYGISPLRPKGQSGSAKTDFDNYGFLTSRAMMDSANNVYTGTAAAHTHNGNAANTITNNLPPYYALAFIMKL